MQHIIILLILAIPPLLAHAKVDERELFDRLDQVIEHQNHYRSLKEQKLKKLKRALSDATDNKVRLQWLDSIYWEYSTYRYDSATAYVAKGLHLAEETHNEEYIIKNKINRASVLSVGGFYSQAEITLQDIDPDKLKGWDKSYFYFTKAWIYNYWGAFVANSEFAPEMAAKKKKYIELTLQSIAPDKRNTGVYNYLRGELIYMDHPTHKDVLHYYMAALKETTVNNRIYAQAAYGVARYYQDIERIDLYEKYLVEAAISDIKCQLKETLALQKFAAFIYQKDLRNSERAYDYLLLLMEDAKFFNNRLRMLEISNILPVIAAVKQQEAEQSRSRIQAYFFVICGVLSITLILFVVSVRRKNKLVRNKKELEEKSLQLEQKSSQMEELNKRLMATNKRRETYMRLFMDISALYIKKLDDYRKLVSRKVKTGQTTDLLKIVNSIKVGEEEAKAFYVRFDKAFMELYPDFVDKLNELLMEDQQIELPSNHTLTTEVRIYALMRLGVTDSQEIATLLFYSTQTIYNYKSSMRAKAKNRETFESDINQLCHII